MSDETPQSGSIVHGLVRRILQARMQPIFTLLCLFAPSDQVLLGQTGREAQRDSLPSQVLAIAVHPSDEALAQAKALYAGHQIIRVDDATPEDLERLLRVRVGSTITSEVRSGAGSGTRPTVVKPPSGDAKRDTIAVRRSETGALHVFLTSPGETPDQIERAFAVWSAREFRSVRDVRQAHSPGVEDDGTADPGPAWTEISAYSQASHSASANEVNSNVRVYRLNADNSRFDYYMVLMDSLIVPQFQQCGFYCYWLNNYRDLLITLSTEPDGNFAALYDHGPTGTITTSTTGFTIGASLGANAAGPTGGISASFSETWSQPSVTTTDRSNGQFADWHEDFTQPVGIFNLECPGTTSGTFLSHQSAIFQVPAGSPTLRVGTAATGGWVNWSGLTGTYETADDSLSFDVFPPQLSVSPASVVIDSGSSKTIEIKAVIPSDPSLGSTGLQLGWTAVQTGANWMSVAPPSGSGNGQVMVSVNAGTAPGLVGYVSIETNPESGAPSVGAGPIVVQVTSGRLDSSSTTLKASAQLVTKGAPITFTALVSGNSGVPAGTVTFLDGTTPIGSPVPLSDGQATLTTSALSGGPHSITASYSGQPDVYRPSTSGVINVLVHGNLKGAAGGYVNHAGLPCVQPYLQSSTLVLCAFKDTESDPAPTGSLALIVNGRQLQTHPITFNPSSVASCSESTIDFHDIGAVTFPFIAQYFGDTNYAPVSGPGAAGLVCTINPAPTVSLVTSSSASISLGKPVTFTSKVSITSPHDGYPDYPEGGVTFADGNLALAMVPLQAGVANYTTSTLASGKHVITAVFNGTNFGTSQGTVSESVAGNNVTVKVSASPATVKFGQKATLQANVTSTIPDPRIPTGNVTFRDGAQTLLTVPLVNGIATLPDYQPDSGGTHTLSVAYQGDAVYEAAVSEPLSFTVGRNNSQTTLTISQPLPGTVYGEFIDMNVAVSNLANNLLANENGLVTFTATGSGVPLTLASIPLKDGKASWRESRLPADEYNFTATWSGTGNYLPSTSNPRAFSIAPAQTELTLTSTNPSPSGAGQPFSTFFQLRIVKPGGGTLSNSANVRVVDAQGDTCSSALAPAGVNLYTGGCSVTPTSSGALTITIKFAGDQNYLESTDNTVQRINANGPPAFGGLLPETIVFGTKTATFTGVISAPGPVYPPTSETVTMTAGGISRSTGIERNGRFAFNAFPVSSLAAGSYPVLYSYRGSLGNVSDSSTALTIAKAAPTFTSLTPSQSITAGTSSINVSGMIGTADTHPPASESISISAGSAGVNAAIDAAGKFSANLSTAALLPSITPYLITYTYAGDANFQAALDSSTHLLVIPAQVPTTTQLSIEGACAPGNSFVLVAAVKLSDGANADGGVVFKRQGTIGVSVPLGSAPLSNGVARLPSHLAEGQGGDAFSFIANYLGNPTSQPGTGSVTAKCVNTPMPTTTQVQLTPETTTVGPGFPTLVSVKVSANNEIPEGSVQMKTCDGNQQTSALDSSGNAVFTVGFNSVGTCTVTASYPGNNSFAASTGSANEQVKDIP